MMDLIEPPKTVILSEELPPAPAWWSDVIYIAATDIPIGTAVVRPDFDALFVRGENGWSKLPLPN